MRTTVAALIGSALLALCGCATTETQVTPVNGPEFSREKCHEARIVIPDPNDPNWFLLWPVARCPRKEM
jgi:hypothetical protein